MSFPAGALQGSISEREALVSKVEEKEAGGALQGCISEREAIVSKAEEKVTGGGQKKLLSEAEVVSHKLLKAELEFESQVTQYSQAVTEHQMHQSELRRTCALVKKLSAELERLQTLDRAKEIAILKKQHFSLIVEAEKNEELLEKSQERVLALQQLVDESEHSLIAIAKRKDATVAAAAEWKSTAFSARTRASELTAVLATTREAFKEVTEVLKRSRMDDRRQVAASKSKDDLRDQEPSSPISRVPSDQESEALTSAAEEDEMELDEFDRWMEQEQTRIEFLEQEVVRLRQAVDMHKLQEDLDCLRSVEVAKEQMQGHESDLVKQTASRDTLVDQRFNLLTSALSTINAKLAEVYQYLTASQGDAYLGFTNEKRLLFTNGIVFNARPDQRRWRPFSSLSGGQQALATLALSFALQAAFPSPFYFFDEVDAALDTLHAGRVADYILSQADAQYIVVSHRPQVFERADCLVGMYTYRAASRAVVADMRALSDVAVR
eukprot:gene4996-34780_t